MTEIRICITYRYRSDGLAGALSMTVNTTFNESYTSDKPETQHGRIRRERLNIEDILLSSEYSNEVVRSVAAKRLIGLVQHPELHNPGLRTSIIKTVNTWFSEGGLSKSSVVGEIEFSYNPHSTPSAESVNYATIRLQNLHVLEKIAANPAFVTPLLSEKGKSVISRKPGRMVHGCTLSDPKIGAYGRT